MRIAPIVIALAIVATGLTLTVPEASAVGWCSKYLDNGPADCGGYTFCLGYRWDYYGFQCQHGIRDLCDLFTCGPGPVLP